MVFIDSYKHEISPEVVSEIMPDLKEDFLKAHPCKWKEVKIQLWQVAAARIENCDPSIEKHSFLCTPVLFDKKGKHRYFTFCEKTVQEQKAEFDQQFNVIHEFDGLIPGGEGNTEIKVKLFHMDSELDHGPKL